MDLISYNGNVNDLVQMNQNGKAVMEVEGKEVRLLDEMSIRFQMVQPGSVKERPKLFKGRAGQFYLASLDDREEDELDAGEEADYHFVETLRALPIGRVRFSRGYFPDFDSGEKDPLCRSDNGIFPSPRIEGPYSVQCARWKEGKGKKGVFYPEAVCPESQWVNGDKPACTLIEDWAFFDLDLKIPFILSLKSTALGAFNQLSRRFNVLEVNAMRKGFEVEDYFIRISTSDEGTYRQLKFKFEHDPDGTARQYHPLALWYIENTLPILGPDTITDDPAVWAAQNLETDAMTDASTEPGGVPSEEDTQEAEQRVAEASGFSV